MRSVVDNPGDFSDKIGNDLYLNPWWALRFQCDKSCILCHAMTEILGEPDLWFTGYHMLLWGRRNVPISFRPGLHANLSGGNGQIWFNLWLPWRGSIEFTFRHSGLPAGESIKGTTAFLLDITPEQMKIQVNNPDHLTDSVYHGNVLDTRVDLNCDLPNLLAYARAFEYPVAPYLLQPFRGDDNEV